MKTWKFLFAVVAVVFSLNVQAQKNKKAEEKYFETPEMPVNDATKLITYEGVISVPGKNTEEVYKLADKWMHAYFKNAEKVIKKHDPMKGRIYAAPRFRVLNPPDKKGRQLMGGIVKYSLKVEAHNGELKYKLDRFNWKQPSYYPIEKWMDTNASTYQKRFAYFLQQVDSEAKKTVEDLKKFLTKPEKKSNDDW